MARHALEPELLPEPTPIIATALGVEVVGHSDAVLTQLDNRDWYTANGMEWEARSAKVFARSENEQVITELGTIRTQLGELPETHKLRLDSYLQHYFQGSPRDAGYETYTDWLSDGSNGARSSVLIGFLREHINELSRQQQSREVQTTIMDSKQAYLKAQEQAIVDGWLSAHAYTTATKIYDTKVYIGDVWDSMLQGLEGDNLGYHYEGSDYIVVAQALDRSDPFRGAQVVERIKQVTPHEFNHVQFGHWLPRWLKESTTEHVRLGLQNGDFATLDPDLRTSDPFSAYHGERKLTATLLGGGTELVGTWRATRAYSSEGPNSEEWKKFSRRVDTAWQTPDMIATVTATIESNEAALWQANPDWPRWRIQYEALQLTQQALEYKAMLLHNKQKPQPVGAAAMSRTVRTT
jgi:hypothetical protein